MKDYTQNGEQAHVLAALAVPYDESIARAFCQGIRVLEIGAWNAEDKSNSRALIEFGASAILIEPSPVPLAGLARFYCGNEKVGIIGAAITPAGGMLQLEITDDAVSAPVGTDHEVWREKGGYYGIITVPSIAVADFVEQFGSFDFVSIDTEGTSVEVFAALIATGMRPRCICLEHDGRVVEVAGIAEAASYRQVHLNGTNVVLQWKSGL